jgi:hypothetical protein
MLPIVLVLEKPNYSDDIRAEEGKADWMIDKPSLIPLRKNCSSSADNPGLSLQRLRYEGKTGGECFTQRRFLRSVSHMCKTCRWPRWFKRNGLKFLPA